MKQDPTVAVTSEKEVAPPPPPTPLEWVRENLFSTWYNSLLTIASLALLFFFGRAFLRWALYSAEWGVITTNLRLFMVGQYPPDQVWRVGLALLILSLLLGMSWGVWSGTLRTLAVALGSGYLLLAILPFGLKVRLWLLANVLLIFPLGFSGGRALARKGKKPLLILWLISPVVLWFLVQGFGGPLPMVPLSMWGGLLLTFVLTIVGIAASFPLGILLALGRRSQLPAIKLFSILYIELIRGVPLVTVLFMAQIMLPLFLPGEMRIDRVIRAMAGFTLFTAAYMAENVRGGLQAVGEGQIEAARALGFSGPLIMALIVLPQALRAVIPAIVNQFISLFKDTSLVAIIGLLDLLNIGRAVLAQPQWMGKQKEVYVFVAMIYFIFSYAMSYASLKLERALGVGQR